MNDPRQDGVEVVAHRGAAATCPENTLQSLEKAIEAGADTVETDVRLTADDVPVLMHDATVDRTTDGAGRVADHTVAELRQLDAGDGEQVPTLDTALDLLAEYDCTLRLELKEPGTAAATLDAVDAYGLRDRTVVVSFLVSELASLPAAVRTGLFVLRMSDHVLERADDLGVEYVLPYRYGTDRGWTEQIQDAGWKAGVWTWHEIDDFAAVFALGTDSVTTYNPEAALEARDRR